jgi:sulfate adenylyltransferase subunit 1
MDILRIATAGSVDDGKSTLIGRLLYDTKSITKDKLEAIEATSKRKGLDFVDLSLLTDGLIAEREQGITIDVAHIYFATNQRKYIIADTPGHIEYTRNMITGASKAEASIVLIDARNGVWEQTRRHLSIFALMKIKTICVCINKMDMVGFDENTFNSIRQNVVELVKTVGYTGEVNFIPVSAKYGENIVTASKKMDWYTGKTLLAYLEEIPVHENEQEQKATLPVQMVVRPHSEAFHDYRGYAGKIASGVFSVGDKIVTLPSLNQSTIKSISKGEQQQQSASAGESVVIELQDDIDVSRGNMIVNAQSNYAQINSFDATLTWLDDTALTEGKNYLLQHGINRVKAKVTQLHSTLNIETMAKNTSVSSFGLNDIGTISVKTAKPIFADSYVENPANGTFILIDEQTNKTVGVGFLQ